MPWVPGLVLAGVALVAARPARAEAHAESRASAEAESSTRTDTALEAHTESSASAEVAVGRRPELEPGLADPRRRYQPRRHRFRLGLQFDYVRLSSALNPETGESQRFHYLPLQVDFAYQLQFLRYLMVRPSLAVGGNPVNTMEAMPAVIHPQIFAGYQGPTLGVAFGYGWFNPIPERKDVISDTRGGLGQPIITNNHHVGVEVSATTRVDRGAMSFALRLSGVKSHIQHFELDERSWRAMLTFNWGWYFGDGHRSAERQRERDAARADRRRERRNRR